MRYFNFFGVVISVNVENSDVEFPALDEFSFFTCPLASGQIFFRYLRQKPPRPRLARLFRFRNAVAFGLKNRWIEYDNGSWVFFCRDARKIQVDFGGTDIEAVDGLLHKLLSSTVGWELESNGWQRLHACGFVEGKDCEILFAPSGYGKSQLAFAKLASGARIFSDEVVWISPKGVVHPWPINLRLSPELKGSPKRKIPLPSDRVAVNLPFKQVSSPHSTLAWIWYLTLGIGHQQIVELHLRQDMVLVLAHVFSQRLKFALDVWRGGKLKKHERASIPNSHRQQSSTSAVSSLP